MSRRQGQGALIAIEGGDGAGKSGVITALSAALRARGHEPLLTREPGGTPEAETLRGLLLNASGPQWHEDAELLLVTAARVQHVRTLIFPALAAGRIVVTDRFAGSTLAYQGAGHGLGEDKIRALHRLFLDDLWPDLTLVLDVDPDVGLARSRARLATEQADEGRFEGLADDFHRRVRQSFLDQARAAPERHALIDAHQPQEAVQADAVAALDAFLDRRDA